MYMGLRLIAPPVSGRSNHKSFLQELSFSIQTHSNCKMALIVGFVSISEMMNSKRKMCIRELTEYCTFSNCSLLSTGMPFLPLDGHQVPRGLPVHCWSADLITLLLGLLCRQSYTLYRMTVLLFVWQPNNFFIFMILIFSLILLSCTSTTLNRNDASRHICFVIWKECY